MKATKFILLCSSFSLLLASCVAPTGQGGHTQGGTYQDPNNPYAVPGVSTEGGYGAATSTYDDGSQAPYQPIPSPPVNPPATSSPTYSPTSPAAIPSTGGGSSHTVVKGDTLWGLSRQYNVSVDELRQANALTSDTIILGQTLTIPR
ncbi:LysM peptidoglycan-binding domain-containing protein [Roseibacillus ishigakijimensis]|uniref:LysM peptidoglycan-binding domain-containing protein n=1 Tax=Roseibacillus ishigakijimensis TaxID=454146 RepID=A0A934VNI4_9BACT|nr:LysM peptidoglycan-binding domain-containing protein [Roseibacillus ishigakijimensis]MBK1835337.1 LysM peptidoglycan-binding domain-containing protein [Roseibacillus ishigakijimensis]